MNKELAKEFADWVKQNNWTEVVKVNKEQMKYWNKGFQVGRTKVQKEVEELREELCKMGKVYSGITEKLFYISHKRHSQSLKQ